MQVDQALIEESRLSGNSATGDGGGVSAGGVFNAARVSSGQMQIRASTLSGNSSASSGGAVKLSYPDGSRVQMLNSTVDGNAASVVRGRLRGRVPPRGSTWTTPP